MVAGAMGIFSLALREGHSVDMARTMAVNTLVVMEIFYLFSVRYVHGTSLTWQGVLGTPAVLAGVSVVIAAQFAFTYAPPLQAVFGTEAVGLVDGLAVVATGVTLLVIVEIEKRLAAAWRRG
jgi:magnesium-transporting ATPase (P-type)